MTLEDAEINSNASSEQEHPRGQANHANPPVPPPPAELQVPPPHRNPDNPYETKKHWLDYATFGVEILGLAGLAIYACFTLGIYKANQESASAAKKAACIARNAFLEAQRNGAAQSLSSQQALDATINNFHLDQRAWATVVAISGVPEAGKQFIVQVNALNSGKTLAKEFVMHTAVQISPANVPPKFELPPMPINSISVLAPNVPYIAKNIVTGDGSDPHRENPQEGDIDNFKSAKWRVFAFGRIDYADVFHQPHWTLY